MIENIARYIEDGDEPFEAALKGAKQIGFTIVSLTVSLIAVLIPLLFMGGIVGRLFREFAVTLSIAIGVSAVLSLTLTPMMCAHLAEARARARNTARFYRALRARLRRAARSSTTAGSSGCSAHQPLTLLVTMATLVFTVRARRSSSRRASSRSRTPGCIIGRHRGGAGHLVPAHDGPAAGAGRGRRAGPRRRRPWPRSSAPTAPTPRPTAGGFTITLKPRTNRKASAEQIIARLGPRAREGRRDHGLTCRPCRTCRSTAASAGRSTSTRWRTPNAERAGASGRRRSLEKLQDAARS